MNNKATHHLLAGTKIRSFLLGNGSGRCYETPTGLGEAAPSRLHSPCRITRFSPPESTPLTRCTVPIQPTPLHCMYCPNCPCPAYSGRADFPFKLPITSFLIAAMAVTASRRSSQHNSSNMSLSPSLSPTLRYSTSLLLQYK